MPPIADDYTDEERQMFADGGTPVGAAAPVVEAPLIEGEVSAPELPAAAAPVAATEPAPVAAVEGAAAPEGGAPADPATQQQQMVPHAALHAERVRANTLAREMATLQARTNAILEAQRAAAARPEQLPNLDEDPAGYLAALERQVTDMRQAQVEQTQTRALDTAIDQDESGFALIQPDYPKASEHYVQSRARELLQFHKPEEVQTLLTNEVRAVARQAWSAGIPAGQAIYNLAVARGYVAGQRSPFDPAPAAQPALAPAATPAPAQVSPQAAVEAIRAGQKAGRSLGAAGGASAPAAPSAESLLAMSDEEFEAFLRPTEKGANTRFANAFG